MHDLTTLQNLLEEQRESMQSINYFVNQFTTMFGEGNVVKKTEYHIQLCVNGIWHQFYINKFGKTKLHIQGERFARDLRFKDMESVLRNYKLSPAIIRAKVVTDLSHFIKYAQTSIHEEEDCAIFVDAGFKDGLGQVAIVEVRRGTLGIEVVAHSKPIQVESAYEAEKTAVQEGLDFNLIANVYTDCQSLISMDKRVIWIPREQNKVADKLSHKRTR